MKNEAVIGKATLESLTTGMYENPFILFREYIQNSADSFDKAFKSGILKKNEEELRIFIEDSNILIQDNGVGLSRDIAVSTLIDIGNSGKDFKENKGFRGIGRLAGISYCEKLIFRTSAFGDNKKITVEWDCIELNNLISPSAKNDLTIGQAIDKATFISEQDEEKSSHYFIVELRGINKAVSKLTDVDEVEKYICEVAPIPFNKQSFSYMSNIHEELAKKQMKIDEYNVFIGDSIQPLRKKYKSYFNTQSGVDYITEIKHYIHEDYYLWIGLSEFKGAVKDKSIKGIRIRKGNIQIGDEKTFSKFFPSEGERANPYFIGELHVFNQEIYPNARRDDFELNELYSKLEVELNKISGNLNKNYRRLGSKVNAEVKRIKESEEQLEKIEDKINKSLFTSPKEKEEAIKKFKDEKEKREKASKTLEKLSKKETLSSTLEYKVKEALGKTEIENEKKKKIDTIIEKSDKIDEKIRKTTYAFSNDLPSSYPRGERKLYFNFMTVLFEELGDEMGEKVRKRFLSEINKKKKK